MYLRGWPDMLTAHPNNVVMDPLYPKEKAKSLLGRLVAIQEGFRVGSFN